MIAVKIQHNCGQKYAFAVEPIGNSIPAPVACPVCGADGTGMANQFIAQRLTMPAAPPISVNAAPAVRVSVAPQPAVTGVRPVAPVARVAAPTASIAPTVHAPNGAPARRLPGQLDPAQAVAEAKSKIMWGDDPQMVMAFLRGNGFSAQEAKDAVNELVNERAKTVRAEGLAKLIRGGALMCVPVFALIGFLKYRFFPVQVL